MQAVYGTQTIGRPAGRCGGQGRDQRTQWPPPHGHYKTTTVTAALRASGPFAVHLMDGATNGARFLSYITNMLVPALTPRRHGHHGQPRRPQSRWRPTGRSRRRGARLRYLPAYSPDFNPIEQAFAKLKTLLRTAAARTVPDLWTAIRNAFIRFKPDECRNYLAAAGYDAYDPA